MEKNCDSEWFQIKSQNFKSNTNQITRFPNKIFILQIKSLCVIQSWFQSNHDLDLPITVNYIKIDDKMMLGLTKHSQIIVGLPLCAFLFMLICFWHPLSTFQLILSCSWLHLFLLLSTNSHNRHKLSRSQRQQWQQYV